jgi:hypothetical protein
LEDPVRSVRRRLDAYTRTRRQHNSDNDPRLTTCIKAYALDDRLVAPVFLHYVNDKFIQFYSQHKGYLAVERCPLIELAFNNIPLDSVVLQFLVDDHCTRYWFWRSTRGVENEVRLSAIEDRLPPQIPASYHERQKNLKITTTGEKLAGRYYREHATNSEKCNCKAKHMRNDALVDFGFFG